MKNLFLIFAALTFMSVPALASENWSFTDTASKSIRLSDFKGKWVLVNFWATWCPPCFAEVPALNAMKHENIAVIGIAVGYSSRHEVLDFMKARGMTYPVILGNEDIAGTFGGIDSLPTSFLYSPEGKLVGKHEGPLTEAEVGKFISSRN